MQQEHGGIARHSLAPLLPWQLYLLAWCAGLAAWGSIPAATLAFLVLLLLAPQLKGARLAVAVVLLLAGVVVAFAMAPGPLPRTQDWMREGRAVPVHGRVATVEHRQEGSLRIILEQLRCTPPGAESPEPLRGALLWNWYSPQQTPPPGSLVQVSLRLRPMRGMANENVWDYEGWWAGRGVRYKAWSTGMQGGPEIGEGRGPWWWRWRQDVRGRVLMLLRPAESQARAIVFALLFGERGWLQLETRQLFRDGGVAHSLALSGLHVGMAVLLGFLLARALGWPAPRLYDRLPRQKLGAVFGASLALAYIWLGGWSPSLVRAGLMFFFWGLLYLRGRENPLMDGLFMALAVILVLSPGMLFDLRLQLSAVAVAGIACLLEFASPTRLGLSRASWWLLMLLATSLAAQLAVLPLVSWNFGRVAAGLWLNALWLPVLGFVVLPAGLIGLLASLLSQWPHFDALAQALFSLAAWPAGVFLELLRWLQGHELLMSLRVFRAGWPGQAGYWLALLLLVLLLRRRRQTGVASPAARHAALVSLALVLLALPGLRAGLSSLGQGVGLRMLDVGQGQSLLLELPRGRRLLLDGGGFPFGSFDVGEAIVAPALTANRPPMLDWVVLSHADSDHSKGLLALLAQFTVGRFASSGRLAGEGGRELVRVLDREPGLARETWQAGRRVDLGDGLILEVLHPAPDFHGGSDNEDSLALRLVWQGRGLALMPGDLQDKGLEAMLHAPSLRAQVLVLPHHGGWSGAEERLLAACAPRLALASAGYLNRYGFPHEKTLAAARSLGVPVLDTASFGGISLRWDGPEATPVLSSVRAGLLGPLPDPDPAVPPVQAVPVPGR